MNRWFPVLILFSSLLLLIACEQKDPNVKKDGGDNIFQSLETRQPLKDGWG